MKNFCIIMLLFFIGCENVNNIKIIGRYYVTTVDIESNRNLSYKVDSDSFVGIVENYVFAVGNDENYIIIKQHPQKSPIMVSRNRGKISVKKNSSYNDKLDTTITNYFIVPIYKRYTYFPEKGIIGPLNLNQFNKYTKLLKIKTKFKYLMGE